MRILGFSKRWPKLEGVQFTTFRFPRKDRDWEVGEKVRIALHPRTKGVRYLGVAKIIAKEPRRMCGSRCSSSIIPHISDEEAVIDGFQNYSQMWEFLVGHHSKRGLLEPINKITLRWESLGWIEPGVI